MAYVEPAWSKRIRSSWSMSSVAQASIHWVMVISLGREGLGGNSLGGGLAKGRDVEILAVGLGGGGQGAFDEVILILQLAQQGGPHLGKGLCDRGIGRGQVVLDDLVQFRQRVVGDHRE